MTKRKDRGFRLGTTSFIFPDHIIPNVEKLGPYFDEIELLVFESRPQQVIPSRADVETLFHLSHELDLKYNIHLPVDVSLTARDARDRKEAADTLIRVIRRFEPLAPTTHTLHLPMPEDTKNRSHWEKRAMEGLDFLIPGLRSPESVSVETLDYPPEYLDPILDRYPMGLCLDAGHHFRYGHDLEKTLKTHGERISIIHLHGVDFKGQKPRDHTGLDRLPKDMFSRVERCLECFEGTLSLEVFSLDNLNRSLGVMKEVFSDIPNQLNNPPGM